MQKIKNTGIEQRGSRKVSEQLFILYLLLQLAVVPELPGHLPPLQLPLGLHGAEQRARLPIHLAGKGRATHVPIIVDQVPILQQVRMRLVQNSHVLVGIVQEEAQARHVTIEEEISGSPLLLTRLEQLLQARVYQVLVDQMLLLNTRFYLLLEYLALVLQRHLNTSVYFGPNIFKMTI